MRVEKLKDLYKSYGIFIEKIEKSILLSKKESFKTIKIHYDLLAKLLKKD